MEKYILALVSIILGSVAQLFLKKGSVHLQQFSLNSIFGIFTSGYLLMGLFAYGCSALIWINVLSKMKLSVAYPLVSLGFVFTIILSAAFLQEQIKINQIVGIAIIILGIITCTRNF